MKCPNDQTEMEKGMLIQSAWVSGDPWLGKSWYSVLLKLRAWPIVNAWPFNRSFSYLVAWKCFKCGKIELYTEEKK